MTPAYAAVIGYSFGALGALGMNILLFLARVDIESSAAAKQDVSPTKKAVKKAKKRKIEKVKDA